MKKEIKITLIIGGIALVIVGLICGIFVGLNRNIYPGLSEDSIAFDTTEYIDTNDDNAGYLEIEYNGRKYMPYGTLQGNIKEKDIDKCIGYVIQDEKSSSMPDKDSKATRIYTLTEDKDNNFLMEYYIGTNLMNQPSFYRAVDTKGEDISIPSYIDPLEYNYWK